ncbi:MAG: type I restriction enzyme HsdR N-terminal domain-containing protein [Bacteroidetes bacterium]|jgi:hypothetical protein|nr:type I restriction enzyme HsdR N-terminal domain-containing protein [Bacteroidota bacterium]
MQPLNFPNYTFRFKNNENRKFIFDPVRKKYILLTPEEWVRQNTVQFLIHQKGCSINLINVEKKLIINGLLKRYDIIVFYPDGSVWMIVECKAPSVKISQETFDQIARYNMSLNSKYLLVTNGLNHYSCRIDFENKRYIFLEDIPNFQTS